MCLCRPEKTIFVTERFLCAVRWVELAFKNLSAFLPAPSQHLLTLPSEEFSQRKERTRLNYVPFYVGQTPVGIVIELRHLTCKATFQGNDITFILELKTLWLREVITSQGPKISVVEAKTISESCILCFLGQKFFSLPNAIFHKKSLVYVWREGCSGFT